MRAVGCFARILPDTIRFVDCPLSTRALVLEALCRESCGYGASIIAWIAEQTGCDCKPAEGSIYPILVALENEGAIRLRTIRGQHNRARFFELTAKGRAEAEVTRQAVARFYEEAPPAKASKPARKSSRRPAGKAANTRSPCPAP